MEQGHHSIKLAWVSDFSRSHAARASAAAQSNAYAGIPVSSSSWLGRHWLRFATSAKYRSRSWFSRKGREVFSRRTGIRGLGFGVRFPNP